MKNAPIKPPQTKDFFSWIWQFGGICAFYVKPYILKLL